MQIKLKGSFSKNRKVDEFDTRQIKKALNRLGYYYPFKKTGITGIPDTGVFDALKAFQTDHGLPATGKIRPGDQTIETLSQKAAAKKTGKYIWRSAGDDKVRSAHAALNGKLRDFADSPDPGEDFNCRCWAEPVSDLIPNERERNRVCIDLHKRHQELETEIAQTIPRKIFFYERDIERAEEDLKRWERESFKVMELLLSRPGKRRKARISIADIIDMDDSLKKAEKIQNIHRTIQSLKAKIKGLKHNIEHLEQKKQEKYQELLDAEEQIRLLCGKM